MIEQIQTNQGQEQEVVVPYGDVSLRLKLQFDDYEVQWFVDLIDEDTQDIILSGVYLKLGIDALFGYGLDFGTLGLIDTDPDNAEEINLKADLGDRVQLVRDFNA
jgi:hypothetical protein